MKKIVKFKQVCVGQYKGTSGLSFVVIGLGVDGHVYKFLMENGWERIEASRERAIEARQEADELVGMEWGD